MKTRKLVIAAIVSGLVMWVLAGVWHMVIMRAFYATENHAQHEGTGLILLAYLVLSLIMSFLYPRSFMKGRPILDGLLFGLVIGVLWVFPHELAMAGAHGESIAYVFKNAAWHLIEQGVGGIVVGAIYRD